MNFLDWLAEQLPTGKAAPAIAEWQAYLAKAASHDQRAIGHVQLWKIYNKLAAEKPFLSRLFRALANHQLDQALLLEGELGRAARLTRISANRRRRLAQRA